MSVKDIMQRELRVADPATSLSDAAEIMRDADIGALPVVEGGQILGMVTDRDIVIRAIAENKDPDVVTVREIMTPEFVCVFEEQSEDEAAELMAKRQIRRLPVLNRDRKLVGMLSLGDLARHETDKSGEALREISQPT